MWEGKELKKDKLFGVEIGNRGRNMRGLGEFREGDVIDVDWIKEGML